MFERRSSGRARDEVAYFYIGEVFCLYLGSLYGNFQEKNSPETSGKSFKLGIYEYTNLVQNTTVVALSYLLQFGILFLSILRVIHSWRMFRNRFVCSNGHGNHPENVKMSSLKIHEADQILRSCILNTCILKWLDTVEMVNY